MSRDRHRRPPKLPQIQLDKRSATALRGGHPWVWPEALEGMSKLPGLGQEVTVTDSIGAFIGRGLMDAGTGPAIRIFSREERDPPLRKLLFRRIATARRLRERLVQPTTDAYRLLHGEGDQLPGLVVDRYGPVLVVRPDGPLWNQRLEQVVEALCSEGGAGIRTILHKPRGGDVELLWGDEPRAELEVNEEGRSYIVRPGHGQKTGFFLDQRPTRDLVQRLVRPGDRCLNLFSFTGGFSVAMAVAGAAEVTSVDLSESILRDCRAQFPLNGIDDSGHHFITADIFDWLPKQGRGAQPATYDLIVCDPPAMARKRSQVERAREAYRRLHTGIAPLLAKGGLLVTCSCTARLGQAELLEDARRGLRQAGRSVSRVVYSGGAGGDHPVAPGFTEGHYLSCLVLTVD